MNVGPETKTSGYLNITSIFLFTWLINFYIRALLWLLDSERNEMKCKRRTQRNAVGVEENKKSKCEWHATSTCIPNIVLRIIIITVFILLENNNIGLLYGTVCLKFIGIGLMCAGFRVERDEWGVKMKRISCR